VLLLAPALLLLAVAARGAGRPRDARRAGVLAVGVLAIGLRSAVAGEPVAPSEPIPSGDGPWSATVEAVGSPRDGTRPGTLVLDVEGGPPVRVAATLPWYPEVVPGDRVEVAGRIRPPPQDEYGDYLAKIGALGTLRADSLDLLPPSGSLDRSLEGVRRAAAAGLDRSMPEPESGLAAGVLIGLRDRVDRDLANAFTVAGASHVVAISGWNIAIVASTLGALAGGLRRRRRAILTALAIVAYVAFVGPSPSVVRAGVMAGVALIARELGRPGSAAAALGWAVTLLLLLDPEWASDAGFRLSVLATAGIIAWGTGLTERLSGANPSRPRRWIAEILGVSFAAQAATMPVVLSMFGRLSLVAPAVNLLVVPLVPPAMAAGALSMVVGMLAGAGVPPVVATVVGLPAWLLYAAMVTTVRIGAGLPLASLELVPPWDTIAAAVALAPIVAGARWGDTWSARLLGLRAVAGSPGAAREGQRSVARRSAPRAGNGPAAGPGQTVRIAATCLAMATIGLTLVLVHRPDGLTRVVVLDVGQGDGILVEGSRGGRLVIDGGPDPSRLLIALDERLPPWDRRIDVLILSHPHEDHVAGLGLLLERYRVGRVYEPGMIGPGPGYEQWARELAALGTPHGRLQTGDRLTLDTINLRVLWPDAGRVPEHPPDGGTSINNVSIVLQGEVGSQRFLLMGDVEEGVDPELLARGIPSVDLLKVAHHGSKTASTEPFLEAARPKVAVVSAGAGNPYGHPAPSTIQRLAAIAGKTYRTDTNGTVEVTFTGQTLRVSTSGPRVVPTPRPTPAQAAVAGAAGATAVTSSGQLVASRARSVAFLCGVPPPDHLGPIPPPGAPEAAPEPRVAFGAVATAAAARGLPRLGRIAEPAGDGANGHVIALAYHPFDVDGSGRAGFAEPRERPVRVRLGRRRVRARGGGGGLSEGPHALPGWAAGSLAPGGASRVRPPPGRDSRAARDGHDVRRRQRRDRARDRRTGPQRGREG
jgi:competence protein ComEC